MIHAAPGLFLRYEPRVEAVPLLVDVSRSGREYPKEYRSPLPFTTVHDNVSMYVEDIWAGAPYAGATMLYCSFPNTWIDVNRSELDMDPAVIDGKWPVELKPTARTLEGLGLIKTKARFGEPFQERKLAVWEVEERLNKYYRPYHAELKRIADELYNRFGVLRQISCHCMSSVGAPTHPDAGKPRADFCVSDIKGTTASKHGARRRNAQGLRLQRVGERPVYRQRAPEAHSRSGARHRQHPGGDQQEALPGYEDVQTDGRSSQGEAGPRSVARCGRGGFTRARAEIVVVLATARNPS